MHIQNGTVYVHCGVCGRPVLLSSTQPAVLPDGKQLAFVDRRPRTPTGGRLGFGKRQAVFVPKLVRHEFACQVCRGVAPKAGPRLVKNP